MRLTLNLTPAETLALRKALKTARPYSRLATGDINAFAKVLLHAASECVAVLPPGQMPQPLYFDARHSDDFELSAEACLRSVDALLK